MQALVFSRAILSSFLFMGSILILQQSNSLYKYIVFSFFVQVIISIWKGFGCYLYSSIIGNIAVIVIVYSIKCKSTLYLRYNMVKRTESDDSFASIIRRCKKRIATTKSSSNTITTTANTTSTVSAIISPIRTDKKIQSVTDTNNNNEKVFLPCDEPLIHSWHNFCVKLNIILYRISIYKLLKTLYKSVIRNKIISTEGINNVCRDFVMVLRRFFRIPHTIINNNNKFYTYNKSHDTVGVNIPNDISVLYSDLKDHTKYKFINPFISSSSEFLYAIEPIFVGVIVIMIIYFCIDDIILDTNFPSGILVSYLVWLVLFLLNYAIYRPLLVELDIRFCNQCASISSESQHIKVVKTKSKHKSNSTIFNRTNADINIIDEEESINDDKHSHINSHKQSLYYYDTRRKYFGICVTVMFLIFIIVPTPLIYGNQCFIEKQEHILFLIGFVANLCIIYFY